MALLTSGLRASLSRAGDKDGDGFGASAPSETDLGGGREGRDAGGAGSEISSSSNCGCTLGGDEASAIENGGGGVRCCRKNDQGFETVRAFIFYNDRIMPYHGHVTLNCALRNAYV